MAKKNKIGNTDPKEEIKNLLWKALEIARPNINSGEFDFMLYFLLLQRDNVFDGLVFSGSVDYKSEIKNFIFKAASPNKIDYTNLYPAFENIIYRIDNNAIHDIIRFLASLNQNILRENFSEIFDDFLYIISQIQGRFSGEFIQPLELSKFICDLASLPENASVYNPFAGAASFGILMPEGVKYFGQEKNQKTWAIGALRLLANGKTQTSSFDLDDSISNWNPRAQYFDAIIANPPFSMRLDNHYIDKLHGAKTINEFLISSGLSSLKHNGKLIFVLPQGFLFRGGADQSTRQFLIENDLLEMVLSFPGGLLMNTAIPFSVIVINKEKKEKGFVRFVDAESYVENISKRQKRINNDALYAAISNNDNADAIRIVSNDTIRANDFNFSVKRFFVTENIEPNVQLTTLGEVAVLREKEGSVQSGTTGKYVRIRDLKSDFLDCFLEHDDMPITDIPIQSSQVKAASLLLALRFKSLKPTLIQSLSNKEPVFISNDIAVLRIDESKVDPYYLIAELNSNFVQEQVNSYSYGATIPTLRKKDLLNLKIRALSLNEQLIKVNEIRETLSLEKGKSESLKSKIHGLEAEIIEQNTYLRHTLAGPSSNLKDSISNIKKILHDKVIPSHPELLQLKISNNHLVSLGEYLEIIERDAAKIVSAVTSQLKVDTGIDSKKLIPIEIFDFIEKYAAEYNDRPDLNFKVEFAFDKEVFIDENGIRIKTFISANEDLLRDLFDNLIDNAVKHAFSSQSNNRIEIFLMKYTDNEDMDEIQILFSNTGKPFPEDFKTVDFIRKGIKFGSNAGDGYGGWYINEIIKKLGGDFEIIDETGPEGLTDSDLATSFEINFPIIEIEENGYLQSDLV